MKTTISIEQTDKILAALRAIHVSPFEVKSCNPKYNAQRNLSGRTHYVDDETLRWHKSRIISANHLCGGLLFRIVTSDALNMQNTKRGFRAVVHDVFGNCVSRPELENAARTSDKALKESNEVEFDVVAHYRKEFASRIETAKADVANLENALKLI